MASKPQTQESSPKHRLASIKKKNYSKQLNEQDPIYTQSSDLFFNDVNLPALTHEQKEYCNQEIIESEIL